MRHTLTCLLLAVTFMTAAGQTAKESITASPELAAGIYNMTGKPVSSGTKPPKGYRPFYISHYGRHGARYMVSENYYTRLLKPLEEAHKQNMLTPLGDTLFARAKKHYMNEARYHEGELTAKGWEQHKAIAHSLYRTFPEVFRKADGVYAISTLYNRCIMSMNAFCCGLKEMDAKMRIHEEASRSNLNILNPFDKTNPYRPEKISSDVPWDISRNEFAADIVDSDGIFSRIFSDTAYGASLVDPLKFAVYLYNHIYSAECTDNGYTLSDLPLLSTDDAFALWQVENLNCYYTSGITSRYYLPIVTDIISKAEEDMAAECPPVRLRFGHDSCIHGIMTLLDIDGFGRKPESLWEVSDFWQCYRTPMASTMIFIFYKSKKNPETIFKILLNGEEVSLPFEPVSGPYYRWSDFTGYVSRLQAE